MGDTPHDDFDHSAPFGGGRDVPFGAEVDGAERRFLQRIAHQTPALTEQSDSQTVSQSDSQTVRQSVSQSVSQTVRQSVSQTVSQSVSHQRVGR